MEISSETGTFYHAENLLNIEALPHHWSIVPHSSLLSLAEFRY